MINLDKVIYGILSNNPDLAVTGWIHTWDDNKDIREDYRAIFPQITFQSLDVGNITKIWVRTETYQISAWATTKKEAKQILEKIINAFHLAGPTANFKSCVWIRSGHSTDPDTKTWGYHADFSFVILEQ